MAFTVFNPCGLISLAYRHSNDRKLDGREKSADHHLPVEFEPVQPEPLRDAVFILRVFKRRQHSPSDFRLESSTGQQIFDFRRRRNTVREFKRRRRSRPGFGPVSKNN